MRWFIEPSWYQYTLRLLPNWYFWSLFGVPRVCAVRWPRYCLCHKYCLHFSAVLKIMRPCLNGELTPLRKPLNSGSSGWNQLSLEPLLVLTYLSAGLSRGLLLTASHLEWRKSSRFLCPLWRINAPALCSNSFISWIRCYNSVIKTPPRTQMTSNGAQRYWHRRFHTLTLHILARKGDTWWCLVLMWRSGTREEVSALREPFVRRAV